jgi:hypothetical protein
MFQSPDSEMKPGIEREREGKRDLCHGVRDKQLITTFFWQLKSLLKYAVLALAFITEETVKGVTHTKTP